MAWFRGHLSGDVSYVARQPPRRISMTCGCGMWWVKCPSPPTPAPSPGRRELEVIGGSTWHRIAIRRHVGRQTAGSTCFTWNDDGGALAVQRGCSFVGRLLHGSGGRGRAGGLPPRRYVGAPVEFHVDPQWCDSPDQWGGPGACPTTAASSPHSCCPAGDREPSRKPRRLHRRRGFPPSPSGAKSCTADVRCQAAFERAAAVGLAGAMARCRRLLGAMRSMRRIVSVA